MIMKQLKSPVTFPLIQNIFQDTYNLVDNGEDGVPMKALYDYDAVEVSCDNPFISTHFSGYNLVDNGKGWCSCDGALRL